MATEQELNVATKKMLWGSVDENSDPAVLAAMKSLEPSLLDVNKNIRSEVDAGGSLYYESDPVAITTGGLVTVTHNFGVKPKYVILKLKCTVAALNYAVGDVIMAQTNNSSQYTSRIHKVELFDNTVDVRLNGTSCFLGTNSDSGGLYDFVNTRWELIVGVVG